MAVLPRRGVFSLRQSPPIEGVVTISISEEALGAIAAILPDSREADRRRDGKGGYFIILPHSVVAGPKPYAGPVRASAT